MMGDQAIVVIKGAACAMYLHWNGREALEILEGAVPKMCQAHANYSMARLIGHACSLVAGSVGVLPAPKDQENVSKEYSLGDAGVVVYDCGTGDVNCYHGYLADDIEADSACCPHCGLPSKDHKGGNVGIPPK